VPWLLRHECLGRALHFFALGFARRLGGHRRVPGLTQEVLRLIVGTEKGELAVLRLELGKSGVERCNACMHFLQLNTGRALPLTIDRSRVMFL